MVYFAMVLAPMLQRWMYGNQCAMALEGRARLWLGAKDALPRIKYVAASGMGCLQPTYTLHFPVHKTNLI
jgi:hypothetical protein